MQAESNSTLVGTVSGTFLSITPNLNSEDIVKTIILATIGAAVSFTLSVIFKHFSEKHKK